MAASIAIGQGGRMVALELITGQRVWEINIAGISTPWVAGDWVFVVTDEAQAARASRASTGKVRWISQLPRYARREGQEGPDLLGRPDARRRPADPRQLERRAASTSRRPTARPVDRRRTGDAVSLPPIVANNTLYILERRRPADRLALTCAPG